MSITEKLNAIDNAILGPPKPYQPVSRRRKVVAAILIPGLIGFSAFLGPRYLISGVLQLILTAVLIRVGTGVWPFQDRRSN